MKERQLYDYQLDMKRRVGEAFGSHRSVMVQMPTGTGKTCLLVACVRAWLSQNEGTVWIVVHRRELVEQIVGTLQEEDLVGDRVRVFSIQWLSRHEGELAERPGLSRGEGAGTDGHALPIDASGIHGPLRGAAAVVALRPLYRRGSLVALRLYVGEGGQRGLAGGTVAGATWGRWRLLAAGDERAAGREAEYRAPLRYGVALCTGEEGHRLCD